MPSLDKVDLNLFVILNELHKEKSVTKVASKLNITQPAVSNSLSRLRSHFDDPLFVKTPSGMQPTPVTESVIADVRRAVTLLERSVKGNVEFDPSKSNKILRLSMADLAASALLPGLVQRLSLEAPQVSVTNYYRDRDTSVAELKSGNIDFLIDAPAFNAKEFDQETLINSPYMVFMRDSHPLAGKSLTLKSYLAYGHIHISGRNTGAGQADIALHARGNQREIKLRTSSYMSAIQLTQSTDYLWTAPKAVAAYIPDDLLFTKPPLKIDPLILNVYWRKSVTSDPSSVWFRKIIADIFSHHSF